MIDVRDRKHSYTITLEKREKERHFGGVGVDEVPAQLVLQKEDVPNELDSGG